MKTQETEKEPILLQCIVPYPVNAPFTVSSTSSSPHVGQGVPRLIESPSIQKAGQIPCLVSTPFPPNRTTASATVRLPAAGVNVYLDSTRPEIHPPETLPSRQGTSCSVVPPLVCTVRELRR